MTYTDEEQLELEPTWRSRRARVNNDQWLEQADAREIHGREPDHWDISGRWFFWIPTIVSAAIVIAAIVFIVVSLMGGGPKP